MVNIGIIGYSDVFARFHPYDLVHFFSMKSQEVIYNQDDSLIHILHSKELMMATSKIKFVRYPPKYPLNNDGPEKLTPTFLFGFFDPWQALEVAYQDLRSAFLHFLQTRGADRPFFIAGHSQGVGTVRENSFCWIGARTFSNCFWQGIRESLHIKR